MTLDDGGTCRSNRRQSCQRRVSTCRRRTRCSRFSGFRLEDFLRGSMKLHLFDKTEDIILFIFCKVCFSRSICISIDMPDFILPRIWRNLVPLQHLALRHHIEQHRIAQNYMMDNLIKEQFCWSSFWVSWCLFRTLIQLLKSETHSINLLNMTIEYTLFFAV